MSKSIAVIGTIIKHIKPGIKDVTLDVGFNDPPYAEAVLNLFDEMMSK